MALLILAEEKTDAVEGTDYIRIWDDDSDEDGDICDCEVDEFALMGWGYAGSVEGDFEDQTYGVFHRGYNRIEYIEDNIIYYNFDDYYDDGLELESIKASGDSGGSATVELDDGNNGIERVLIGVGSFAVDPIYEDPAD